MNSMIYKTLIFFAGAAAGSAVTAKILREKYEEISNQEIESIREYYKKKETEKGPSEETKEGSNNVTRAQYDEMVTGLGYHANRFELQEEEMDIKKNENYLYEISVNDYSEFDNYRTLGLSYYQDGIITDEEDNLVDNDLFDAISVLECVKLFGEFGPDAVYVRDDEHKIDYEIVYVPVEYEG